MAIPLTAEHDNATPAKALAAALQVGSDVHVLVAGNDSNGDVGADARLSKVLLAQADELTELLPEPLATFVVSLVGAHDTIIAPAISSGKNVAPRVAALLDVISPHASMRPIYTGNPIQPMLSCDATKVISERPTSCSSASQGNAAAVENISAAADPCLSILIENKLSETDRPELTSAKIIISGGSALGSSERFHAVIPPVADKLGSPMSRQRPGRQEVVAPDVCTAVGVSGAIQHLASSNVSVPDTNHDDLFQQRSIIEEWLARTGVDAARDALSAHAFSAEDFDATVRDTESRVLTRAAIWSGVPATVFSA
ncbi:MULTISPECIES: FAD-binding protein [unclassified Mesorhizobium]|uniref:electron transfer flavoprotein subunit alpha/FixB family protein n=1 Tax=unclassified Mesorhizobium TaxID=325217 RepID=UPI000FE2E63E|nr:MULTISPECIES: FAD-binding protein [unclassified Mesorhizobium]RWQ13074.1 MAG: electron transfer flavoprotein subunit alpha/FixB family protein [Mesorhizobium sp.]TGQ37794.1 electron transfer flavoprotein subunit alpha/FixB family protein [Mesorhizobium sp. M4B.F.Ca.ET.214.01.1.1]TGQ59561.1 electron transfer flavoprotein subunit alpha/FixB family protein [Mesorhizobium sp. M4B.F.Ca.ET.211.01.1.1]TGU34627.1 electron transfer flavoprotein subunit alpha/FixB family protein [Mesorhizobium sp. M4B